MITFNITQWAAWWGAILATVVFAWDVFKWIRRGPRLRVRAYPNMQTAVGGKLEDARYISVSVTNIGGSKTTIRNVGLNYYEPKLFALHRTPTERMIVKEIHNAKPLSQGIDAGSTWDGLIDQSSDVDRMLRDGVLTCAIYEARRDKPWQRRINPNKR